MKRLFFISAMLMAWVGPMNADEIVVPNIVIPKAGTAILDIQLNNEQELNRTFGLFINLPEGISVVDKSEKLGERFNGTKVSVQGLLESDGRYKIIAINGFSEADDFPIPDNSGTIVTVELTADESIDKGTVLDASIENIEINLFSKGTEATPSDVPTTANFQITIGEPDDGRLKFYETSTSLKPYTAGTKADVTLYRTIKAGQWNTIVLPFNLTKANATAIFGSDVEFAEFSDFEVDYGDDEENITPLGITINFKTYEIPARGKLEGGTPVLIKTSKDINEIKLDQVTLKDEIKEVNATAEYETPGKFTGSFVKTTVPEDGLFLNGNKFYYSTGKTAIKGFRGWFELGAVLDKETDFGVRMVVDGAETRVEGVSVRDAAGTIYDLSGRRVSTPARGGVYIVNGKKVLMK